MCCALGSYRVEIPPGYAEKARADPSVALISTLQLERPVGYWGSPSAYKKHLQMKENLYLPEIA